MNDCQPVLISLGMMPALFGVKQQTVHRWNTAKAGAGRLPKPDLVLDEKPLWFEETIRDWGASRPRRKLVMDEVVLARICQSQGVG